ncbi:N-acetylmuramoyl-L-alanine amidase family protein [Anaerosinus massiliensis]|uniref:N-acetylmuramoyl-L-alanine amidase family protein n=1 Tax=Massilibacillus massiliensis TaxID=1806837 RepID=UPI000A55EEFB|nr:N-acetylmuramoyl-L-alanine amidase [Massilibacillus massiliensis]
MKICINAGHYPGLDSGAVGTFLQEADVVKNIGEIVCRDLEAVGYEVLFVQENELADITSASNSFGADLFVSIHCNAAANLSAQGTETFCYRQDSEGESLASYIQNQIVNSFGTVDRGVKYSQGLYVLKHTECPAVLVETAFISNYNDEQLLANRQADFAHAIARGVTDYFA